MVKRKLVFNENHGFVTGKPAKKGEITYKELSDSYQKMEDFDPSDEEVDRVMGHLDKHFNEDWNTEVKIRLVGQEGEWRKEKEQFLNKKYNARVLSDFLKNTKGTDVVAHDFELIREADVVIVNGEQEIGPGTAMEMVVAKQLGKTVLTVLPLRKGVHEVQGKREWVHPFILAFSDVVVESFEKLPKVLRKNGAKNVLDKLLVRGRELRSDTKSGKQKA